MSLRTIQPTPAIWRARCTFAPLQGTNPKEKEFYERVSGAFEPHCDRHPTLGRLGCSRVGRSFVDRSRRWMDRAEPCKQRRAIDAGLGKTSERCVDTAASERRRSEPGVAKRPQGCDGQTELDARRATRCA